MNKIKVSVRLKNIAPFEELNANLDTPSLKIGIYANNGSGKTYISRMFRLLETTNTPLSLKENGDCPTDSLLKFGSSTGNFSFSVTDSTGVKEDISVNLSMKSIPAIPKTQYAYHTFNQDYVDDNIKEFGYNKDGKITGYILGKTNIDLSDDEAKLNNIKNERLQLRKQTESNISHYLDKNINSIRDIKRIKEYDDLLKTDTLLNIETIKVDTNKTLAELLSEHNKIKSIPDNIQPIPKIEIPEIDLTSLKNCIIDLQKVYSLSSFAQEFKNRINGKRSFYENGVTYYTENPSVCPFCGQAIAPESAAAKLIDDYTTFLSDKESNTIRGFNNYTAIINSILQSINNLKNKYSYSALLFNQYKTNYLPSFQNSNNEVPDFSSIKKRLQSIIDVVNEKIKAINVPLEVLFNPEELYSDIESCTQYCSDYNSLISGINLQLSNANNESRKIRREICKAAYLEIRDKYSDGIKKIEQLRLDTLKLEEQMKIKRDSIKTSKKEKIYDTITEILDYFFAGKYTLDSASFKLVFENQMLDAGQTQKVLSEGEKRIIAFAYYLGDAYKKIENESDYTRLFFIIDDPISSMDYSHVYTICGVLRDINKIYDNKIGHSKFIILTHNNDFMQILTANKIIETSLLLENGNIHDDKINFTIPYVANLMDIYRIAKCDEQPSHGTGNAIRYIIETIIKFQNINQSQNAVKAYIENNFNDDIKTYTLINDLSHGGWRSSQQPISTKDYILLCQRLISHIESKFPNQIKYCQEHQNDI